MADETWTVADVTVELVVGDIAAQPDVDAVVNAANAQLMPGGGVAGALHRAAGPRAGRGVPTARAHRGRRGRGDRRARPAHRPRHPRARPVHGRDEPSDELLADTYRHVLELADEQGFGAVATPAISTGAFGFPADRAARIALRTVAEVAPRLDHVRTVRFVLFDRGTLEVHRDALAEVRGG